MECLFQIGLCQALGVDVWKARSALGKQWLSQCMEGKASSAGSTGGSAALPSMWSRAHLSVRSGVSACGHPDLYHSELLGRRLAEGGTRGPLRADLETRMGGGWGIWRRSQEHGQSEEME